MIPPCFSYTFSSRVSFQIFLIPSAHLLAYAMTDSVTASTILNAPGKSFTAPDPSALRLYIALKAHAESFPPLRKALSTLEAAFRLYSPANLAVAFNGGKDATIVMHLARAVLADWCVRNSRSAQLHCLFMLGAPGDQFPEVEAFVRAQARAYHLHVAELNLGIRDGIADFVGQGEKTCAFVIGTRRGDPHGTSMEHFEPSSPDWSPFMRVNPILTFDYHHVWHLLRHFDLPYCCLYDQGYTSLGSPAKTLPNPALRNLEGHCQSFRPAWMLEDASLERAGRHCKKPSS